MHELINYFKVYIFIIFSGNHYSFLIALFAIVVFIEFSYYLLLVLSALKYFYDKFNNKIKVKYFPRVSAIIPCYSEGWDVEMSIGSFAEQIYPGVIEIIPVIDGAKQNYDTLVAVRVAAKKYANLVNRKIIIIPKYMRGGRVSSLNTALKFATGEIIMIVDADTSLDNQAVANGARRFYDKSVAAVAGALRVRNSVNLVTKLQSIEYLIGIVLLRVGMSGYNSVNVISGAFGFFRRSVLERIGGPRTGTSDDLDTTVRIQSLFAKYKLKTLHSPESMGHTAVPDTWSELFKQRFQWDSDWFYIVIKRYIRYI